MMGQVQFYIGWSRIAFLMGDIGGRALKEVRKKARRGEGAPERGNSVCW